MGELALVVVLVLGIGFAAFMVIRHHSMRTKDDVLRAAGVPTSATVLRLRQDAASGEDDLYVLSVEMDLPSGWTYRTANGRVALEMRAFLAPHVFGSVQPGSAIRVRFDPRDPTRAVVDLAAMGLA